LCELLGGLAGQLDRSGFDVVGQYGDAFELITPVRAHRTELHRRHPHAAHEPPE
jgi:hypothetical protein